LPGGLLSAGDRRSTGFQRFSPGDRGVVSRVVGWSSHPLSVASVASVVPWLRFG
jgi:hypothetical protein